MCDYSFYWLLHNIYFTLYSTAVENFDYIIKPTYQCRDSASHGRFGDGRATYSALTVAFWARFTRVNQNAVILNIFGANSR